jgi:hypothetical protein
MGCQMLLSCWSSVLPVGCHHPRVRCVRHQVGDLIVVDGGMVSLEVASKAGPDVSARVVDPGIILSRANLTFRRNNQTVRARNAMLPVLSSKARPSLHSTIRASTVRGCLAPWEADNSILSSPELITAWWSEVF